MFSLFNIVVPNSALYFAVKLCILGLAVLIWWLMTASVVV